MSRFPRRRWVSPTGVERGRLEGLAAIALEPREILDFRGSCILFGSACEADALMRCGTDPEPGPVLWGHEVYRKPGAVTETPIAFGHSHERATEPLQP